MLKNMIQQYINDRYENDGVLPDADEIYEKFQLEFDNGADLGWIDSAVYNFTRCHDLEGITVLWEGRIHERSLTANH